MRRLPTLLATVVIGICVATPLNAQTVDDPNVVLEAEIGLEGWVDSRHPVPVRITVRSDLLFAGSIYLATAGSPVLVPAEVPAGGSKTFELLLSNLIANRNLRIDLRPAGSEAPIESITIRPDDADQVVLVATLGLTAEPQFPATTDIGQRPLEVVQLEGPQVDPGPADYLVVGDPGILTDLHRRWMAEGGTVIVERTGLDRLAESMPLTSTTRPDRFELGAGEVLVVETLAMETAGWATALRGRAGHDVATDPWAAPENRMLAAAGASRSAGLARPGPLIALAVYAVLVAPLNLIVLRRMGKREWAWVTVPALALVAAIIFAVLTRFNQNDTQFAQATVVVGGTGGDYAYTAMIIAADAGQRHQVSVDEPDVIYPATTLEMVGVGGDTGDRSIVSMQTLGFHFPQAGYSTARIIGRIDASPKVASPAPGLITVTNTSPYEFEAWGVSAGGAAVAAGLPLPPEASGEIDLDQAMIGRPVEAIFNRVQGPGGEHWWRVYEPLSTMADHLVGSDYFFGFVADLPVTVNVD
ncbi:MAG TPA: hypothetical protein VJR05_00985, partial [Acidimicrobiia bacterium]|nr:hypothetical protein [Acidimicrobiia bacterium]